MTALLCALVLWVPSTPCVTLRVYDDPTTDRVVVCERFVKAVRVQGRQVAG